MSIKLVLRPWDRAITAKQRIWGDLVKKTTTCFRDSLVFSTGSSSSWPSIPSLLLWGAFVALEFFSFNIFSAFLGTAFLSWSARSFWSSSSVRVVGNIFVVRICRAMIARPQLTTMPMRSCICWAYASWLPHCPVSRLKNLPLTVCPTCMRQQ